MTPSSIPLGPALGLRGWLSDRDVSLRFGALALLGAFSTGLFLRGLVLQPFGESNNETAQAFANGVFPITGALLVAAPVMALLRPGWAVGLAVPMAVWVLMTGAAVPLALYVALLAVAMVAVWRSGRVAVVTLVLALVPIALVCLQLRTLAVPFGTVIDQQYADAGTNLALFGVYAVVALASLGFALWIRAAIRTDQRERGLTARSQAVANDAAVVEERARLARDLHDVVAHHVSLIAVRAETAPYQVEDLSESGRALLAEIAHDARTALDELRGVLGVLQRSSTDTAPQPTWDDVAALVESAVGTGQRVQVEGTPGKVGGVVGYTAYRVVQEALTNARRHAPGAPVRVIVDRADGGSLQLLVLNPVTSAGPIVPGRGLTGMRERVESLGGSLETGHVGGDFVVRARLPWSEAS